MDYYVHILPQAGGAHEVHLDGCWFMPLSYQLIHLGTFKNSVEALTEARRIYPEVGQCQYCCGASHPEDLPERRAENKEV